MSLDLKNKRVFLIPYWVKNTLQRQRLPPITVRDLRQLRTVTSTEDLVLTAMLNTNSAPVFGADAGLDALYQDWTASDNELLQSTWELRGLHENALADRLFNESAYEEKYPTPFEILDMDDVTLLVTIYPGHFVPGAVQNQGDLVRALLKQLYAYMSYDKLAHQPLFERYMALLQ